MEADVDGLMGAGRYERGDGRQTWRNGYRDRSLDTRLGTLNLKIPKMRQGAYFPGFLEPRKMVERALSPSSGRRGSMASRRAMSMSWCTPWRMTGISKFSVSKLYKDIDERVNAFHKRPLSGDRRPLRSRAVLDELPARSGAPGPHRRQAGDLRCSWGLRPPSAASSAQHGRGAAFMRCAMRWPTFPRASTPWSRLAFYCENAPFPAGHGTKSEISGFSFGA